MNYNKLKKEGYYIKVTNGTYKNNKHTEYSLTKDISKTNRKIYCLLNYKAVNILINRYGFKKKTSVNKTVWLQVPESLNLKHNEPLIITWS